MVADFHSLPTDYDQLELSEWGLDWGDVSQIVLADAVCVLGLGFAAYARALGPILLGLTLLSATVLPARQGPAIVRWSAEEIECPGGTELRRVEAPDGSRSALWCEASRGTKVARHGPYLELYADGSTARQGLYVRGVQAGQWISWAPDGTIEGDRVLLPGEAGRHIPHPEDLCPRDATRDRFRSYSDRRRLESRCHTTGDDGEKMLVGPYVSWDEEKGPDGGLRYVLRRIMTYENDRRHGPHRAFTGPFGREALVEEEKFENGHPEGLSRSYYLDGSPREVRHYRDGQFEGERVSYYRGGAERWRIVYDRGHRVAAEGDLTVAGEPCAEPGVPTATPDGLKLFCARRQLHFLRREGPFIERDEAGRVVESGRYERDEKVELWQARPGVELPPEVSDEVLVAEIQLMIGERPYRDLSSPPPEEDVLSNADLGPFATEEELQEAHAFDIWFRNNKTKKYPGPRTTVEDGVVQVYGLAPGSYYMKVEIDAEPSNPEQRPGDLTSSSDFEVVLGEVTQLEARLLYTLHLVEPWDNDKDIPGFDHRCAEETSLSAPARFAWRPPGEEPAGIEYHYKLTRRRCAPGAASQVIAQGHTYDTAVEIDLPPSHRDEFYQWHLVAKRGGQAIGQLMTFGDGGYGWSLSFRVE